MERYEKMTIKGKEGVEENSTVLTLIDWGNHETPLIIVVVTWDRNRYFPYARPVPYHGVTSLGLLIHYTK